MVNTVGSGPPLALLLGGGITLVVRDRVLDTEVPFSCKHRLLNGTKKSYFLLDHLCLCFDVVCQFFPFFVV